MDSVVNTKSIFGRNACIGKSKVESAGNNNDLTEKIQKVKTQSRYQTTESQEHQNFNDNIYSRARPNHLIDRPVNSAEKDRLNSGGGDKKTSSHGTGKNTNNGSGPTNQQLKRLNSTEITKVDMKRSGKNSVNEDDQARNFLYPDPEPTIKNQAAQMRSITQNDLNQHQSLVSQGSSRNASNPRAGLSSSGPNSPVPTKPHIPLFGKNQGGGPGQDSSTANFLVGMIPIDVSNSNLPKSPRKIGQPGGGRRRQHYYQGDNLDQSMPSLYQQSLYENSHWRATMNQSIAFSMAHQNVNNGGGLNQSQNYQTGGIDSSQFNGSRTSKNGSQMGQFMSKKDLKHYMGKQFKQIAEEEPLIHESVCKTYKRPSARVSVDALNQHSEINSPKSSFRRSPLKRLALKVQSIARNNQVVSNLYTNSVSRNSMSHPKTYQNSVLHTDISQEEHSIYLPEIRESLNKSLIRSSYDKAKITNKLSRVSLEEQSLIKPQVSPSSSPDLTVLNALPEQQEGGQELNQESPNQQSNVSPQNQSQVLQLASNRTVSTEFKLIPDISVKEIRALNFEKHNITAKDEIVKLAKASARIFMEPDTQDHLLAKNVYKTEDLKSVVLDLKAYRPRTLKIDVGGLGLPLKFDLITNMPQNAQKLNDAVMAFVSTNDKNQKPSQEHNEVCYRGAFSFMYPLKQKMNKSLENYKFSYGKIFYVTVQAAINCTGSLSCREDDEFSNSKGMDKQRQIRESREPIGDLSELSIPQICNSRSRRQGEILKSLHEKIDDMLGGLQA